MLRPVSHCRRGFTLAELLVGMSITIVVVVLLFQVFSAFASQWQHAERRTDAYRDARAAVQLMSRDLSRANIGADAEMLTLKDPVATSIAREAYAVAPMPNSGKSMLCAVGYYCAWDGNTRSFTLKRLFRDSDTTVGDLVGASPNFTALFAKDASREEDLAAFAWDLQFTPGAGANALAVNTPTTTWKWIDVRFKCISPSVAPRLKAMNVGQGDWYDQNSNAYKTIILPSEQQFVTRITLHETR